MPFGTTHFDEICHVGENVWSSFRGSSFRSPLSLFSVPHGTLYILTPLKELIDDPNVYITRNYQGNNKDSYALLLLCVAGQSSTSFNKANIDVFRKAKKSVVKKQGSFHFGSRGEIFSFGVNGRFNNINGSSLGEYSSKSKKKEQVSRQKLASALKDSIISINRIDSSLIKNTTLRLDIMAEIARSMKDKQGDQIKLESLKSDNMPLSFFSSQLNSNATTQIAHTECDITYTLISVPNQSDRLHIQFCFCLQENKKLWLRMEQGISFMYSAYILTHKQTCRKVVEDGNINISAYAPKRLSDCFRKTYSRLVTLTSSV